MYLTKLISSAQKLGNVRFYLLSMLFLGFFMVSAKFIFTANVAGYQYALLVYGVLIALFVNSKTKIRRSKYEDMAMYGVMAYVVLIVLLQAVPLAKFSLPVRNLFWGFAYIFFVIAASEGLIFSVGVARYNKALGVIAGGLYHAGSYWVINGYVFNLNFYYMILQALISFALLQWVYERLGFGVRTVIHGLIDSAFYGLLYINFF